MKRAVKIGSSPLAEFPEDEITAALLEVWELASIAEIIDQSTDISEKKTNQTAFRPDEEQERNTGAELASIYPAMDSVSCIDALLSAEDILSIHLPETIIKRGGYDSKEEYLEDLVAKIRECFEMGKNKLESS